MLKIALLSGGISGEREVSLKTGKQIFDALDKNKYEIFQYDPQTDLRQFINDALDKKFALVFPALHGPFGEDGRLQGLLDMLDMPYVFSGCLTSALAMSKEKTKIIASAVGLNLIPDLMLNKQTFNNNTSLIIESLGLPIVIKPSELGSSVGMSIAKTAEELEQGIKKAFEYDDDLLLEKYVKGRELTVAVMDTEKGTTALPVIEIIPQISDWFDYEAKYQVGGTKEVCPAEIPDELKNILQEQAVKIYQKIGAKSLARADFIYSDEDKIPYSLEINTIPGMTETSLAPQAAKAYGLEFSKFLDHLIECAMK